MFPGPTMTLTSGKGLRAVCQGADGPGAAHLVDGIHTHLFGGHEKMGGHLPRRHGRGDHDHFRHTGDFGRNGAHEHRGDQRGIAALAARHIHAGGIDRIDHLTQKGAGPSGVDPGCGQLLTVKTVDLRHGTVQRPQERPVYLCAGRRHLFGGDRKGIGGHAGCIERLAVSDQRFVPIPLDVVEDPRDGLEVGFPEIDIPADDGPHLFIGGDRRVA